MELSTTSQIRWCSPRGPVEPMYIPGRIRTASSPSRTVIDDAPYSLGPSLLALLLASATCELLASRGSGPAQSTCGNRPTARGHARCSPVRVAGPPAGHVQGPLAPTRFLGTLHLDSPDESGAHGGGDLAEDVGRYQPQLRGPGGARRPDVEDPLLEPLRGGVGRDILADDPVPLREQPSGGDLVVPAPLLGDLADELSEGLRIPRV